jgi:integrase
MTWTVFLDEFEADWKLQGRSPKTIGEYCRLLRELASSEPSGPSLANVKAWLATSKSKDHTRYRARAVRAFGKWADANEVAGWCWWRQVPMATVAPVPQETVQARDYEALYRRLDKQCDRLLVELLWSTGLRVSELARLSWSEVNLTDGCVIVRQCKTGRPRLAPLSERAYRLLRHTANVGNSVLGMLTQTTQRRLDRIDAPTARGFRPGWAVHALGSGVSQTSVQTAAGRSSGAMVDRYVLQASGRLSTKDFARSVGEESSNVTDDCLVTNAKPCCCTV